MGRLTDADGGAGLDLLPWTTVGRAPGSTLLLPEGLGSGAHAVIAWTGTGWTVQDLASRNGTFLDGQRLAAGPRHALRRGDGLGFGRPEVDFRLADESPPAPRALPEGGGEARVGRAGLLSLPDEAEVELLVYEGAEGWLCEAAGDRRPVGEEDVVEAGGRRWRLELPRVLGTTAEAEPALELDRVELAFAVSPDEEHVELRLRSARVDLDVPPRAHHYTLLTLARSRLRDRALGEPTAEEGWEDPTALARRLGLTPNTLFVQLCRARAQLAELGLMDAAALVERRQGGRLRLGAARLSVRRSDEGG